MRLHVPGEVFDDRVGQSFAGVEQGQVVQQRQLRIEIVGVLGVLDLEAAAPAGCL